MIFSAILYVALCIGSQYAAGNPVTNFKYSLEENQWLHMHIVPARWSDAALRCQLEGGVLAFPTSNATARVMLAAMEEHKVTSGGVFIGATDQFSKGNFMTMGGVRLDVIPLDWAAGEPNNEGGAEECVALTAAGALTDVNCARTLPYFCHTSDQYRPYRVLEFLYPIKPEDPENRITGEETIKNNHECGENNNGYELEPRTGNCYKFYPVAKPWLEALSTCHHEGSHLAIINSDLESNVLSELYENYQNSLITGTIYDDNRNYVSIGFRKWDDDTFVTIHGDTLDAAGFSKFAEGEPNNGMGKGENCGSMYRGGLLNDHGCELPHPYICEKHP